MKDPAKLGKGRGRPSIVISIDAIRCKGCAYCVEYCPKEVLVMKDGKPVPAKIELCTGCSLCVWICPEFAVGVARSQDDDDEG